jgi:putative oxidoreductase
MIAGLLFLEHGLMKLIHFPAAQPGVSGDLPPMLLAAGIIEAVGGGLITLGLFTRFAAFIASGEMAAAYFMAHFKRGFWPALNGGDAAILYCFVFFYLVFAGAGAVSLDQMIRKPRS